MSMAWIMAAMAIGAFLGAFYFGGLWITVRSLATAQQSALAWIASFLVRAGLVLFGFYIVMDGRWERLLAAMVGFLTIRTVFIRQLRNTHESSTCSTSLPSVKGPIA